jgi:hypothetical protein
LPPLAVQVIRQWGGGGRLFAGEDGISSVDTIGDNVMKTKAEVAAEIKKLLEENGYRLDTQKQYYASCDNCFNEYVYVTQGYGSDRATEKTIVGSI